MFKIVKKGLWRNLARLVSDTVLTRQDFDGVCDAVKEQPVSANKIGFVAARQVARPEVVATLWEGEETSNTANAGDWVVTNLLANKDVLRDRDGNANTYVIQSSKFPVLYKATGGSCSFGEIFAAQGHVLCVFLPGGFDILAPWGERQVAGSGYLLLNGDDVYGNQTETFRATYEIIA